MSIVYIKHAYNDVSMTATELNKYKPYFTILFLSMLLY